MKLMKKWYAVLLALIVIAAACPRAAYADGTSVVIAASKTSVAPGGTFTVVAHGNSPSNVYIQRAVLNGREHTASHIDFADIAAGGTLELYMGDTPNTRWGI